MRKVTCAKCSHEDEVEDIRWRPTDDAERVLSYAEAREVGLALAAGDVPAALTALDRLFVDMPRIRETIARHAVRRG